MKYLFSIGAIVGFIINPPMVIAGLVVLFVLRDRL